MNSVLKENPSRSYLETTTRELIDLESTVDGSGTVSVSYNEETNKFDYSINIGTDASVSLNGTSDVMYHYFGDNMDKVMESGDVFVITTASKYDMIFYKGNLLGYGAPDDVAEAALGKQMQGMVKDVGHAYAKQCIEDKCPGASIAFDCTVTGISIAPTLRDTENDTHYDVAAFPEMIITLGAFDQSMIAAASYDPVCTRYCHMFLSRADSSYLMDIQKDWRNYNDNPNTPIRIDPTKISTFFSNYPEYCDKYKSDRIVYDDDPNKKTLDISFANSIWNKRMEENVEKEIDDEIYLIWLQENPNMTSIFGAGAVRWYFDTYVKDNYVPGANFDDVSAGAGIDGTGMAINTNENLMNSVKSLKSTVGTAAQTAPIIYADPLILDLDGDGFNVESKENGSHFDLDKNSFAEKINWTKKDGYLCLDLNGNGVIDNGGELFGDETLLADGTEAENGFAALAQYDSNKDGIIDQSDEIFGSLRVWVDSDGSGTSGEGEMKTLSELGVKSISLGYENVNAETGTEAVIGNMASFVMADGTVNQIGELWVSSDLFDTAETAGIEIPDDIKALPNIRSIGNVRSLHTAMALDETGAA